MTLALEVTGLSYSFGAKRALSDVSFTVEAASFTALLGPNGAGKTTFFSLATRLFDSPAGAIRIFGRDIRHHPGEALARLGVVFQDPTLDLDLSVEQNLRYAAALHGLGRREAGRRIERELARFGLADRRHEKARRLNGGHRRRIEIARALMHEPPLLLLDEPTVGLDVPTRRQLVEMVHRLCREDGIAVLWTTHLIDELDGADDRVVLLSQGRVQSRGTIPEVLAAAGVSDLASLFTPLAALAS
ncbi:ABC transporter ATP-binding protein [Telmatospirillum siberiense]|uniref:ABC transporter ATP-binding protein n=1 Tax=Telmatospirillum siberiense TaxID=382514 RepID=A0A2N3PXR3_9PROT|nr:ABC transporter ATP-binding protein [Telmatospirillum siberiense]PKU25189.1 ABC transporter ATP-binding protein [Telmatospirillum siberiense]